MSIEEEVRAFVTTHVPHGDEYLNEQPVPYFGGKTWAQAFQGGVSERAMTKVLSRLRDLYGARELWNAL